jgi:phage shock protein E
MFGLEKLFKPATDYKLLLQQGAIVIDVRSAAEFAGGHVSGARNISLDQLNSRLKELQKLNKPIVTCCQSGARSAMAARLLKSAGITTYNAGPWHSLQKQLA